MMLGAGGWGAGDLEKTREMKFPGLRHGVWGRGSEQRQHAGDHVEHPIEVLAEHANVVEGRCFNRMIRDQTMSLAWVTGLVRRPWSRKRLVTLLEEVYRGKGIRGEYQSDESNREP
jgi:hypothetical protein